MTTCACSDIPGIPYDQIFFCHFTGKDSRVRNNNLHRPIVSDAVNLTFVEFSMARFYNENMSDQNFRRIILQAGKAMQKKDLTVETWGNISVRDPETGKIFLTPSGMPYDTLEEDDIVVLNENGDIVEGRRKPSVEKMLHVRIYQSRSDVNAILHTHPVDSTVFAVLHESIPVVTDEIAQAIGGSIDCAEYGLPGSMELAENVQKALGNKQACLMANHGAVCVGKDISECFKVAEVLETGARIYARALSIGKPHVIPDDKVAWMRDFAVNKYGQK